jgi:hypothetical protein
MSVNFLNCIKISDRIQDPTGFVVLPDGLSLALARGRMLSEAKNFKKLFRLALLV